MTPTRRNASSPHSPFPPGRKSRRIWWWWLWRDPPLEYEYYRGRIVRTPLDLFDEAVEYVESYINFLDMEVAYPEDDDVDWLELEVSNLKIALELISEAISTLQFNESTRLGQKWAT